MRGRKGGEADMVVCSAWPTIEPSARTLARTRALLAHPWWTSVRALRKHRGREAGSEREWREWGNALVVLRLAKREREQQGGAKGVDTQWFGGGVTLAWSPRAWPRVVLWSKSTNRWRAVKWTVWSPNLGLVHAKSGHGPITRFSHLMMLSKFH
jgi:hypothetical protein